MFSFSMVVMAILKNRCTFYFFQSFFQHWWSHITHIQYNKITTNFYILKTTLCLPILLHNLLGTSFVSEFIWFRWSSILCWASLSCSLVSWCVGVTLNNLANSRGYFVTRWTGTIKNEFKFILLSIVFSICDTLRKIRNSSFSFSRLARSRLAVPVKLGLVLDSLYKVFQGQYPK